MRNIILMAILVIVAMTSCTNELEVDNKTIIKKDSWAIGFYASGDNEILVRSNIIVHKEENDDTNAFKLDNTYKVVENDTIILLNYKIDNQLAIKMVRKTNGIEVEHKDGRIIEYEKRD